MAGWSRCSTALRTLGFVKWQQLQLRSIAMRKTMWSLWKPRTSGCWQLRQTGDLKSFPKTSWLEASIFSSLQGSLPWPFNVWTRIPFAPLVTQLDIMKLGKASFSPRLNLRTWDPAGTGWIFIKWITESMLLHCNLVPDAYGPGLGGGWALLSFVE